MTASARTGGRVPLRAVLFDHDGTLVDSEPVHHRLWNQVLAHYGLEVTEEQYRQRYAGMPTPANAADLVQRHGIGLSPATLAARKYAATGTLLAGEPFPLMPGVREVLAALAGLGLRLGVVTGANGIGVRSTLQGHALAGAFEVVVCSDDVRHNKPAPDCYLLAAQRLGLEPAACIAVEDTEHGLRAALGAGVRCIAVPTPMSRHHDFAGALAVLDSLTAVEDFIRRDCTS